MAIGHTSQGGNVNGSWSKWGSWSSCTKTCGRGLKTRRRSCNNPAPQNGGRSCSGSSSYSYSCNTQSCPIDGGWGSWGSWGSCDKSCGGGTSKRYRSCSKPYPRYGGKTCSGSSYLSRSCNTGACPINGGWTKWGSWGSCSTTCGYGRQYRKRSCTNPTPKYGGRTCSGSSSYYKYCRLVTYCPVDGGWGRWGSWSRCTKSCGGGSQTRSRSCSSPYPKYGGKCVGDSSDKRSCGTSSCAINGGWSNWGSWGSCSKPCGTGKKARMRSCTNPTPKYGGKTCSGSSSDGAYCNTQACPVHGGWEDWSTWTRCSRACGGGSQTRERSCTKPTPRYGGKKCSGSEDDKRSCNTHNCALDGNWSSWSRWGSCTVTCGGGSQKRSRGCTDPAPKHGGKDCVGSSGDKRSCNTQGCPIDGGYTKWSTWSKCSAACGGGSSTRSRSCTSPAPQFGGKSCSGGAAEKKNCNTHNCPIHGAFTLWSSWTKCSQACGGGSRSRSRSCTNPAPQHGGRSCSGDTDEKEDCNTKPCPIDGGYTTWNSWTTCSVTCGGGSQKRGRSCTNPAPQYGGADCSGASSEKQNCNTQHCPIDGKYRTWTGWSSCSKTCGGGSRSRIRSCEDPKHGGKPCSGPTSEEEDCNTQNCPIDGAFTLWSQWDKCSATCGGGTQKRGRSCTNPAPQYGGADCSGNKVDERDCNTNPCPIDGGFSRWSKWTTCSVTCGGGSQSRERTCTNPAPQNGGKDCTGDLTQDQSCNTQNCPIDGGYTDWTTWSSCSVTCGGGSQERKRSCSNPAPQYGGAQCSGAPAEKQTCNTQECPIDGAFTDWSRWSTCSATCGGGTQSRDRTCSNPAPQYGGADCTGQKSQDQSCNTQNCPIDGEWATWGKWDTCTVTCGGGTQTRTRACSNPAPQYGGASCSGTSSDTQNCNTQNCPIDGAFADWSTWGVCSATCGGGTQTRDRTCTNPSPQYGGADCASSKQDSQDCNTQNCPIDGGLSLWSSWSTCTAACDGGTQDRTRTCTNPAPQYGGKSCTGSTSESQSCNTQPCVVNGGWGSWGPWGTCSVTCGGGKHSRARTCTNPTPVNGGLDCPGDSSELGDCNNQACPVPVAGQYVQLCPAGWFTCESGGITCIDATFKCDCSNDCDDGSDESETYASCPAGFKDTCKAGSARVFSSPLILLATLLSVVFAYFIH